MNRCFFNGTYIISYGCFRLTENSVRDTHGIDLSIWVHAFEKSVTAAHGKAYGYGFVRLTEKSITVVYGKDLRLWAYSFN